MGQEKKTIRLSVYLKNSHKPLTFDFDNYLQIKDIYADLIDIENQHKDFIKIGPAHIQLKEIAYLIEEN